MDPAKGSVTVQCSVAGHGVVTPAETRRDELAAERERRLDATIAALNAFEAQYGSFADEHAAF